MSNTRLAPSSVAPRIEIRADELLKQRPLSMLAGRNRTKADILVYRYRGVEIAVKDYRRRSWLVRQTLGRWLTRREAAAYRLASGIPGLPQFLGRVGPYALATRWIDARPLSSMAGEVVDPRCFDRAATLLSALHDRGIALADLHHRDLLISDDGSVHVVDLATAWLAGPRAGALRRALFERFRAADRLALVRMRARFAGKDPAAAAAAADPAAAAWHRRGRRIKRGLDFVRGRRR